MDKKELSQLYYSEGKTLQQIGDIFNLTRERIRQKMESFNLPRDTKRGWPLGKRSPFIKFTSLEDYFAFVKSGGKESRHNFYRLMTPFIKQCNICHSTKNLHLHHIKYPATSISDFQILCASCHFIKHRKGNGYKVQLEICDKYVKGISGIELAKEYKVTSASIYNILHKWNIQMRKNRLKSRNKGVKL